VRQQNGDLLAVLGAVLAEAFPDLHTLELKECDIATSLLEPLVSTAPLKSLRLCACTQLRSFTDAAYPLEVLATLLSHSAIDHLQVEHSLREPGVETLPPLRTAGKLLAQARSVRHAVFNGCGHLHALWPLLRSMPSLTHLEVRDQGSKLDPRLLEQLLQGLPQLRTLLLPGSRLEGAFPVAILKAKRLQTFQVSDALQRQDLS
jgi:hypothetical protein